MQGRFDREDYRTGMNVCLNIIPIEEGSAPRRPGTRYGGPTRNGAYGVVRSFFFQGNAPYDVELTAGHLRLWRSGAGIVVATTTFPVASVSAASPAVVTTTGAHGYTTGDQVVFSVLGATNYGDIAALLGRQVSVTVTGATTFTIADAVTGTAIDGSTITLASAYTPIVAKILDFTTSYAKADLQNVRLVQDGSASLLLHQSYAPQQLTVTTDSSGNFLTASLAAVTFHDGPYLDPPTDGSTLTPNATSGDITLTASAITGINGGSGFVSTDVGRLIRLFSEPLAWASGTAYVSGNLVKYADVYWQAVASSTGVKPDADNGTHWVISTTAAAWTWGTISSVTDTSHVHITLSTAVTTPDNVASGNLLYTNPIVTWQLGLYNNVTWPAMGTYYQGRLWLGGAQANRFDACVTNDYGNNGYINFAPTGKDGTVADNNAIAGTLNAQEVENFLWMLPDDQGVLCGTESGEWIIASSSQGEPITATSIVTREITRYGSLQHQAIKVGRAAIFIHRDLRKVYEYMANYFTQKFVADNLTLRSKHLTAGGVSEVAFVRELAPVIWARLANGGLIGCTYKHDDPIKPLEFSGWHRHSLGHNRSVISIASGPANANQTDTLCLVTQDTASTYCFVEFLSTLWDTNDTLLTANFTDGMGQIVGADHKTVNSVPVIRYYGLWYAANKTVTAWVAGLDAGDFIVSSTGTIDVPIDGSANALLTQAYLASIAGNPLTNPVNVT